MLPYTRLRPPWHEFMLAHRVPVGLVEARQHLGHLARQGYLSALYRELFPTEWAASTASTRLEDKATFSPREWEFFYLVEARLMPIGDIEDCGFFEGGSFHSYRDPQGFNAADDMIDPANFRLGWQMVLVLAGEVPTNATELVGTPYGPILYQLPDSEVEGDWGVASATFALLDSPLRGLPAAVDTCQHQTENRWLDYHAGDWCDIIEWTPKTLRAEAVQWAAALEYLQPVHDLLDWLEADPAHLQETVTLWMQLFKPVTTRSRAH